MTNPTKLKLLSGLVMAKETLVLLDAPDTEMRQNKLKALTNIEAIAEIIANEPTTEAGEPNGN